MDKWLDNLTDSRWFMKVVALVLALLLFGSVYDGSKSMNTINVPGTKETETVSGIPVKVYYDTESLVVSGVPETVKVTLSGPTPNLQAAKTQKDFEVYADLSKVTVGRQRVKLKVKDLSDNVKATIKPAYADVTVQEKVTKEYTVEAEFNHKMVAEGYTSDAPIVKPNKVKITGGKDVMEKISYVKATVDINEPVSETVDKFAAVTVLDENLNKLNVTINQQTVRVTIPIKRTSKTVPIDVVKKGTPPEGITIDSITLDTKEAEITANEDILSTIENVRVEVDVSSIKENSELTLPVIISDGVKEVNPKTVKATIKVSTPSAETAAEEESTTKTFSNLPISINGLPETRSSSFNEPSDGTTSLTVKGTNGVITNIKESDFRLSLNLAGLTDGEHSVKINVTGPDNVSWTLASETANITITEKGI